MSDLTYDPTQRFNNVNGLLSNHFRFIIEALPDLTFYAQSITIPSVISTAVGRPSPFTKIKETGDALTYGDFNVSYLIDASFKSYASLYWWMKGYGFPHSYADVESFRTLRAQRLAQPRPVVREIEKTNAVLQLLQPDTESVLVEIRLSDVFPVGLGEISLATTDSTPTQMMTTASFACTEFDIVLS